MSRFDIFHIRKEKKDLKRIFAIALTLAMLVGVMTVSAAAAGYVEASDNVTYDTTGSHGTANTTHGGGVVQNPSGTAAYAAGDTIATGEVDVTFNMASESTTTNVYAVSINTSELTFTYGAGTTYTWNPEKLKYDISTTGDDNLWTGNANVITVTNYSNLDVTAEASFEKDAGITEEVTGTFAAAAGTGASEAGGILTLQSAARDITGHTGTGTASDGTFTLTLEGNLDSPYADGTTVGTITVTFKVPTE